MDSSCTSSMMVRINQIKKNSTFIGRIKKSVSDYFQRTFNDENQTRAQTFTGKILFGFTACVILVYVFGAIVLSLPHWGSPEILQSWLVLPLKILGL